MKLAILGFTGRGTLLCSRLVRGLGSLGHLCEGYALEKYRGDGANGAGLSLVAGSLKQWTKERFDDCDGLVFIGAAGIAVRLTAPFLVNKTSDPAVVVVDELGRYAISLLSGHLGGANELAAEIANITGGLPVITTATDLNGKFAVDVYAREHGFWISDMKLAKEISADILEEKPVGFFHDYDTGAEAPVGTSRDMVCEKNIRITALETLAEKDSDVLKLVPRVTVLGIGCRRGSTGEDILRLALEALREVNLSVKSVFAVGTIDLKADEPGLISCAEALGVPLYVFSREELGSLPGEFTPSDFVFQTTGVDNVCERAAMAVCKRAGEGSLILRKKTGNGVTLAVAMKKWKADI